jgi:UDP-glucose 4-epimerase
MLAEAVAKAMRVTPDIVNLPPRNEVNHAYSSHEKVRRVFGPRSLHSLESGLEKMAAWVRRHGARRSRKFENIEVTKNFPLAWME